MSQTLSILPVNLILYGEYNADGDREDNLDVYRIFG